MKRKRKVRGKVLKKIKREKIKHFCYFCGTNKNLTQHHIIFRKFGGAGLKKNKEWICENCHKKLHLIMEPLIDLFLSAIQNLQPSQMRKIGFIRTNGKKKKGGKIKC